MKKKHSLIIGGTKGMGRALVKVLTEASRADEVVSVIARKPPAEKMPRARYWQADILDSTQLARTLTEIVKENGKLSRLVFFQRHRDPADDWNGQIGTLLTATKNIIELLENDFSESASIVLVSSVVGRFVSEKVSVGYHVTRAALNHLAQYYAVRLAPKGIRVNTVSAATLLKEESKDYYLSNPDLLEFYKKITPLGRMGTAEEVANVIDFLSSEKASFVTGQNITVDGGVTLQWQESLAKKLSPAELK